MKRLSILIAIITLSVPLATSAHRLDEYLEAAIFSIGENKIEVTMRLVPGVAVSSTVIAIIDANADGILSEPEQIAYAHRVLDDVSLTVDGKRLTLDLNSADFPSIDEIKQGTGEIHLDFSAALPPYPLNANRRLIFENHHQRALAVYLVNTLVPADKNIQITAQSRDETQSTYQLDFAQTPTTAAQQRASPPTFSGFAAAFRLGMHHIAEGTDHLLFLLVLLLPAPLLASTAVRGRHPRSCAWTRRATIRVGLLHILGIVTAFTIGHSLTLALSVFGLAQLPSRVFEVLIAVSILVSGIHAVHPLFPGREAAIAAFFGLIHGLAFASVLNSLGFGGWFRVVNLLGFNLGIETMQLAVVAAVLPSLLLLSRTRAYSPFRTAGALVATIASLSWVAERLFDIRTPIAYAVESAAHHFPQLAVALLIVGLACWFTRKPITDPAKARPDESCLTLNM
jgi:hypothetical protein